MTDTSNPEAEAAAGMGTDGNGGNQAPGDDDAVDIDFEEVKDENDEEPKKDA